MVASLAALVAGPAVVLSGTTAAKAEWEVNATAIEACRCPMFCQCYFNTMTDEPVVICNLKCEFKGTNGFLITIDMTSNEFAS